MKYSRIIFLFCAVIILSPESVFSQADFFQKGESGVGLLVGYAQSDRSNSMQGALLATISGMLDFGFFTNYIKVGKTWRKIESTGYHLGIYPLRESASKNLKINIGIFAEYININGINNEILGISIFKRLGDESFFLQPKMSAIKVWPRGVSKPGEMAYQFDLTAGFFKKSSIITMTTSLLSGEDVTVVGFTAGLAIPFNSIN